MRFSIFLLLVFSACASQKRNADYDYYFFSPTAYQMKVNQIAYGVKPSPNHTTVDGVEFTCACPPDFVEKHYKPNFPDVVLVKKVRKGKGKVLIHY